MRKSAGAREVYRQVRSRLRMIQHYEQVTRNVRQTCRFFGISRCQFYVWLRRYRQAGCPGRLQPRPSPCRPDGARTSFQVLDPQQCRAKRGPPQAIVVDHLLLTRAEVGFAFLQRRGASRSLEDWLCRPATAADLAAPLQNSASRPPHPALDRRQAHTGLLGHGPHGGARSHRLQHGPASGCPRAFLLMPRPPESGVYHHVTRPLTSRRWHLT